MAIHDQVKRFEPVIMTINVVFDLGGVLIQWHPAQLIAQVAPEASQEGSPLLTMFHGPEWLAHDRGELTEAEAFAAITERMPDHAEAIARVAAIWREHLVAIPETVSLLETLKQKGVPLFALSNFPRQAFAWIYDRMPWLGLFDGIAVSSHFGLAKPDPAFFQTFLTHYKLEPASCLFIDDNADNVASAQALGMHAHQHTDLTSLLVRLRQLAVV
jgi:HAD superfamily hydrolase (TIGR01509 family)